MTRLQVPVQLRWSDMDAYGHVNNVELLRLLEEARIEAFWAHPAGPDGPLPAAGPDVNGIVGGPSGDPARDPSPDPAAGPAHDPAAGPEHDAAHDVPHDAPHAPAGGPDRAGWPTAVLDAGPGARTATLVARQEVEYLRPLGYRRTPVLVDMWIGHLGGASIDVCYEVRDAGAGGDPYARAITTLVLVDAATGAPRRIGERERDAWLPYVAEPPTFRRRAR
jgi:acyl-CoA thioester hydrolase